MEISIDPAALRGYSNQQLMTAWHVAQANPADGFTDKTAGELTEQVGREIIRRWPQGVEPELHHHQGRHSYWNQLRKFGTRQDGP